MRPASRASKEPCRPLPELGVGRPELCCAAIRLLEVVPDELVLGAGRGKPVGEARMQSRARRLRDRGVGSIANERVAESERVIAGLTRPARPQELPSYEGEQRRPELGLFLLWREHDDRCARELL